MTFLWIAFEWLFAAFGCGYVVVVVMRRLSGDSPRRLRREIREGRVCEDCHEPMSHAYGHVTLCHDCRVRRIDEAITWCKQDATFSKGYEKSLSK